MALSMILRNSACTNRIFSQQAMKLMTQGGLMQRTVSSMMPVSTVALKEATTSPLLSSVREFKTTSVRYSEKPHDHARLWVIEKATTVLMVPLIPIGLWMPNKIVDMVVAVLITAHAFWGWEAIAVDYVRASIFGPVIPKIAIGLVYALCISTLGGLFYIIGHDVGLANTVRQIWGIKSEQKA